MNGSSNAVPLRVLFGDENHKSLILKLVEFNQEINMRNSTNYAEASMAAFDTNIALLDRIMERAKVLMHLIEF